MVNEHSWRRSQDSIDCLVVCFRQPLFPVDTHIHRVTKRLGWIPQNASAEKAHEVLTDLVPPELHYRLHLNLIRLGWEICQARKPQCAVCPLTDRCEYYARVYRKTN